MVQHNGTVDAAMLLLLLPTVTATLSTATGTRRPRIYTLLIHAVIHAGRRYFPAHLSHPNSTAGLAGMLTFLKQEGATLRGLESLSADIKADVGADGHSTSSLCGDV